MMEHLVFRVRHLLHALEIDSFFLMFVFYRNDINKTALRVTYHRVRLTFTSGINSCSNVSCSPDVLVVVVRQGDGIWFVETGVASHRSEGVFDVLLISYPYARSGGDIGPRQNMELLYSSACMARGS